MRPEKLTDAGRERLRTIVLQRLQIPSVKKLAVELNISESYVRQMCCVIKRELSNKDAVSHGTIGERSCGN
jgi:hypothetical protein